MDGDHRRVRESAARDTFELAASRSCGAVFAVLPQFRTKNCVTAPGFDHRTLHSSAWPPHNRRTALWDHGRELRQYLRTWLERRHFFPHFAGMKRKIIERSEAMALAQTSYFTGRPCRKGHIAERVTSSGTCRDCERERARIYDAANREKRLAYFRAHYLANAERRRAYGRAYYAANREKIAAASREKAQRARDRSMTEAPAPAPDPHCASTGARIA